MNILGITKAVIPAVVSMGVGAVINNAVKSTTPLDTKLHQKIVVGIGTIALSGMVGDLASKHVEAQVDKTAEQFQEVKETIRNAKND